MIDFARVNGCRFSRERLVLLRTASTLGTAVTPRAGRGFACLWLLLTVAVGAPTARAQYRFDSKTTDEGLPQNSVLSILQTRDGYLWVGTFEGLARFDGVNFEVFDNTNTPQFKSNWVRGLAEDPAGNLWIGTERGGLLRRTGDQFVAFSEAEGLPSLVVRTVFADGDGHLWVGTDKGLCLMRDGKFETFTVRDGLPSDSILSLAGDDAGALWVGTVKGLARLKDKNFTVYDQTNGLTNNAVNALVWSQTDGLWIGTEKGLNRWQRDRFVDFGAKSKLSGYAIKSLAQDRAGALWLATFGQGLLRLTTGATTAGVEAVESLSDDRFWAVHVDAEGAVWVGGGETGLSRLMDGRFQTFSRAEGLREDSVTAVYEDRARNLWFSTAKSLYRLTDGKLKIYPQPGNYQGRIFTITEDRDGRLWVGGTARGMIWRLQDEKFIPMTVKDGLPDSYIATLMCDRDGHLWVATGNGLAVLKEGRFTVFRKSDGLISDATNGLHEARDGAIWIGGVGVSRYEGGRFTNWTVADGLSSNAILCFYESDDGAMWLGTDDGGLTRYKDGKFARVTSSDGLYSNLAFRILEVGGDLWMSCNKGVYRASLRELNDFADGRIPSVTSYAYGTADGMLSRECNGASPAGWKTHDGRLWFPTVKGLVRIDPEIRNSQPPLVLLEKVQVDGRAVPNDEPLRIAPGQESVEISYTAISWRRPQHIVFKYQLAGLDDHWTDAGTRRTAYYTRLPPGEYTFRVISDNGDGVWNTVGQSLSIRVLPPFYQTWWFTALAALTISAGVFLAFRYRVAHLHKRHRRQQTFSRQLIESQEQERKRIAAELHDSLGQQLLVIKNWAMIGLGTVKEDDAARETLDEISSTASQAVNEVREIIYDLRPYQLDKIGLANTIKFMVEKVAASSGVKFETRLDDVDDLFAHESQITLYRIVQECVNNIVKHSRATNARVEMGRAGRTFSLTVEDDGRGLHASEGGRHRAGGGAEGAATPASPQPNGFGLTGVAERVRMLGGRQTITAPPGGGTRVHVTIEVGEAHEVGNPSRYRG